MLYWLQFLYGFYAIKIYGIAPERFINLCGHHNILLWKIRKEGEIYQLYISRKQYTLIAPLLSKTGTKADILSEYGLPFIIPFLKRKMVFVGAGYICIILLFISTQFIWGIECRGNSILSKEQIVSYLNTYNINVPTLKKHIDLQQLEEDFRTNFPSVQWINISYCGSVMIVNIKEEAEEHNIETDCIEHYTNLVSNCNGEIVNMVVRAGVPKVKIGDIVEENMILVQGDIPVVDDNQMIKEYIYTNADADIWIKHEFNERRCLNCSYIEKQYIDEKYYSIEILVGKLYIKIPFGNIDKRKTDETCRVYSIQLLRDRELPLHIYIKKHNVYEENKYIYSEEEMDGLVQNTYEKIKNSLEQRGIQIQYKNVTIKKNKQNWYIDFMISVLEKAYRNEKNNFHKIEQTMDDCNE